jgi:hypothetical protein
MNPKINPNTRYTGTELGNLFGINPAVLWHRLHAAKVPQDADKRYLGADLIKGAKRVNKDLFRPVGTFKPFQETGYPSTSNPLEETLQFVEDLQVLVNTTAKNLKALVQATSGASSAELRTILRDFL